VQLNTSKKGKPLNLDMRYIGAGIGLLAFGALAGLMVAGKARASEYEDPFANRYSVNDFGGVGLLQTRTARFAPDGEFFVGASFINPYRRYFLTWQILPFVEATFRYTDPTNAPHGGIPIDQSQADFWKNTLRLRNGGTNLDRGFDVKLRLAKEGSYTPAVAVGFQDFVGTGLFASEYIIASKRFDRFDFSLGIGWGHMGSRHNIPNPFRVFGSGFSKRGGTSQFGGTIPLGRLFSGDRAAIFGGVEYQIPEHNLSIKVEYNGAHLSGDRDVLPEFEHLKEITAFSAGVNYQPTSWFDVSVGWERGNAFMLRGNLRANFNTSGMRKNPPQDPPIAVRPVIPSNQIEQRPSVDPVSDSADLTTIMGAMPDEVVGVKLEAGQWFFQLPSGQFEALDPESGSAHDELLEEVSVEDIDGDNRLLFNRLVYRLAKAGYWPHAIDLEGQEVVFYLTNAPYRQTVRNAGRLARLVSGLLPPEIEKITYVDLIGNFETSRISVLRQDIERASQFMGSREEIWANTEVHEPRVAAPPQSANGSQVDYESEQSYPSFSWWLAPELQQHIGDPITGVYLADVDLELGGSIAVWPGFSVTAVGRQFLFGSLNKLWRPSDSVLPHVRSDIVKYLTGGQTTISRLQADYVTGLTPSLYLRVAGGILEQMYGGVGAEILYRPWGKSWATGFELNWVKQRGYRQLFGFRDYNIVTGHATLYNQLPFFGLRSKISVGRYLAGDHGVTFEFSRRFDSGVQVGVFATFTNVSAEDFGEGSFDKGFFIRIPFDLLLTRHSKQEAVFGFRPLTRDGGQRAAIGPSLFELVDRGNYNTIKSGWRDLWPDR